MLAIEPPRSYRLSDRFGNPTEEPQQSRVRAFEPGQAAQEQLVLSKLGVNGWGRWQYFRLCFSDGWGEAHQRPLSPKSQEMFIEALKHLQIPAGVRPSLFLTDEGFLEIAWKDSEGKATQIEFGPHEFEVYSEPAGEEGRFPYDQLEVVLNRCFGS
ncbi:MAG: hypothetical protein R3F11_31175 [Verrucomicrobiales bacterium]